ncbi:MAG: c-type cytochrome [Gammaproteobacteria bacterium]|mgnify:CR=1 FL=1
MDFRTRSILLAGVLLAALSAATHAADAAAGKASYAVCVACHGPNAEGSVAMNAPMLAGQEPWYLKRQLEAFKSGQRGTAHGDIYGMQMRPMATTIPDAATEDKLVAWIASLPAQPVKTTITGDAAAGKAQYAVCAACHGQNAEGNEQLGGPRLAGQEDWYLVRQIRNYKAGIRNYDPKDIFGAQMRAMAATLSSDKVINDVVAYINSLK